MKKITTLLFALTIALTTFAQNDPISQSWQHKFQTVTLPTYSSGGFTPIVINSTTGQMQKCGDKLILKSGGTHIVDVNNPAADTTAGLTISSTIVALNRAHIIIANVPAYANDTTATNAGLTSGMLHKTTTGVNTVLKIVP